MFEPVSGSSDRTVGTLLRELAEGSAQLLKQEWSLAKLELRDLGLEIGRGTAEVALSGVCIALGSVSVLTGAALALADPWVRLHSTIVLALGVVLLLGTVAWLAKASMRTLIQADFDGEQQTEVGPWQNQRRMFAETSS